jgi:hypothetical protein
MKLKERIARWLAPDIVKMLEAVKWKRNVLKCRGCEKPILYEGNFCIWCGYNLHEKQTTGQVKLPNAVPAQPVKPQSFTDLIGIVGWTPEQNKDRRLKDIWNHEIKGHR